MRILLWTTQTKANLLQPLDSAAMFSRARWRRCSTSRSQSWRKTLRRRMGTPPFQKDRRDRQSSLELQSRITPSLYSFSRLGHVLWPLTYRSDVCESKVEVTSPFWASNSNGKVRAILNNKEFEQAIHQEICSWVADNGMYSWHIPLFSEWPPPWGVTETAPVSRSTSGTDCCPMTPTMTALVSSWIGFYSPPVASAGRSFI